MADIDPGPTHWREIASEFLKLGATSYGGPAIMGVMHIRKLAWTRAVLKGMGPAVIGILAVSLVRIAPYALPDPVAVVGAVLGTLRGRLFGLPVRI
jgi:chromate transport protein ChrA